MDQAKPGDVICYGSGEETSAAGIYVGDGKMVQASETRGKVVTVKIDPEQESFALELFEDTKVIAGSKDISEVNATEAMYGQDLGLFKLTYYCACAEVLLERQPELLLPERGLRKEKRSRWILR